MKIVENKEFHGTKITADDPKPLEESPLEKYMKRALSRHENLPDALVGKMKEQPTKGAAQRLLKQYLQETS